MLAKYQEISHFIREQIRSRKWAPGSRLPTRSELVREYGTTVMTLQKAMDDGTVESLTDKHLKICAEG